MGSRTVQRDGKFNWWMNKWRVAPMEARGLSPRLAIVAGVVALLIASNPSAFAGTVNVRGSGSCTTISAAFSYDGHAPANSAMCTATDNLGGRFTGQDVAELVPTPTSCTAPDGSAGILFVPVREIQARIYKKGQLYLSGAGEDAGGFCVSTTTTSSAGTITLSVTGGTGEFADASGSITYTATGETLAAPGSPPGSLGFFGALEFTETGSVTD